MFTQLRKNTLENARWSNPPHSAHKNSYIGTCFEVWQYDLYLYVTDKDHRTKAIKAPQ